MVSLKEERDARMVDVHFFYDPLKNVYNYIFGKPFFVALNIVTSIINVKMKFHNTHDELVIIHAEFTRSHQIYETLLKDPVAKTL